MVRGEAGWGVIASEAAVLWRGGRVVVCGGGYDWIGGRICWHAPHSTVL